MTVQALIGEHLGVCLLNKRSFKSSQEFFILKSAYWSKESSVICWTGLWSGTSKFWVQPKGRKARVPSGNLSCFFLQKEFDSKLYKFSGPVKTVPFYLVHPYSRRNIDELSLFLKGISVELCFSTTENLFKVNWFATGNKCSWDNSFEMLKGKQQFKVVLNSDERSWWRGETKI